MNQNKESEALRLLLVEDNEHDQIAFKRALDQGGLTVDLTICERAQDMERALQSGSESFDIVVLDYDLPGRNGMEAYRKVSRETELPPFIMLTGAGSERLAVEALKCGMYDYIIKDPNQGYLYLLPFKLTEVKQRYEDRRARLKAKADLEEAHAMLEREVQLRTSDLARTVEALQDEISEREKVEKALKKSELALRSLSLKIIESQENERRLLSKELHDSIGGSLAAIKFALEEKLQHMKGRPNRGTISLEKIIDYILDTIREVRRISATLRPSMLDDYGLLATIEWYCRKSGEMYQNTRIETHFSLDEESISEVAKIVIYRVMQEAVNNALRHSGADTIRLNLEKSNDRIRLRVQDNGCGFSLEQNIHKGDPLSGYGLQGMSDRAEAVCGSLHIETCQGEGTVVLLEI
jgi:signal transduction histidine kinase